MYIYIYIYIYIIKAAEPAAVPGGRAMAASGRCSGSLASPGLTRQGSTDKQSNRNPQPQLEPLITSLDKLALTQVY